MSYHSYFSIMWSQLAQDNAAWRHYYYYYFSSPISIVVAYKYRNCQH